MMAALYSRNMRPFVITIKKSCALTYCIFIVANKVELACTKYHTRKRITDRRTNRRTDKLHRKMWQSQTAYRQLNHSDLKPDSYLPDVKKIGRSLFWASDTS